MAKNIVFVTALPLWSMNNGSGGKALCNTLTYYSNKDYNVYLITSQQNDYSKLKIKKENIFYFKENKLIRSLNVRILGFFVRIIYAMSFTFKARSILKKLLPTIKGKTIIYAYEVHAVKACKDMSKKYHLPLVTRFQGTIMYKFSDNLSSRIRNYPHHSALSTKSNLVIMTDDGTKGKEVLDRYHNDSKILFIRNGVNILDKKIEKLKSNEIANFNKKYNISDKCIKLLTVSRLESWKKVERSIYALKALLECDKERNYHLLIVGDGSDRDKLELIVKENKLENKVTFVGSVPNSDVCKYMQYADIFMSFYDLSNVGNPLLEALCLGKTIITYDVGDTRTVINNENGILLDSVEPNKIANAIKNIVDENKFDYYSNNAISYAKNKLYSWDKRMKLEEMEIVKLYENNS